MESAFSGGNFEVWKKWSQKQWLRFFSELEKWKQILGATNFQECWSNFAMETSSCFSLAPLIPTTTDSVWYERVLRRFAYMSACDRRKLFRTRLLLLFTASQAPYEKPCPESGLLYHSWGWRASSPLPRTADRTNETRSNQCNSYIDPGRPIAPNCFEFFAPLFAVLQ